MAGPSPSPTVPVALSGAAGHGSVVLVSNDLAFLGVRTCVCVPPDDAVESGLVVGLAAAVVAAQALRGLLYGVAPIDPLSLTVSLAGIAVFSAAALMAPLRAAGRVEPADVLRAE